MKKNFQPLHNETTPLTVSLILYFLFSFWLPSLMRSERSKLPVNFVCVQMYLGFHMKLENMCQKWQVATIKWKVWWEAKYMDGKLIESLKSCICYSSLDLRKGHKTNCKNLLCKEYIFIFEDQSQQDLRFKKVFFYNVLQISKIS